MSQNVRQKLGHQIRSLRLARGLTQDQLATQSGISTKYLQNLEGKNPKKATIETIERLASGFKIPMWQLLKF